MLELLNVNFEDYELWGELYREFISRNAPSEHTWDEDRIILELEPVIKKLGSFPTTIELREFGASGIVWAILINGGIDYFKEKMGYILIQKSKWYWTEKTIIFELKSVIDICDDFPSRSELIKMNRQDLIGAISKNGGINYFRVKMGYESIQNKPTGYWTEKTIISELDPIIEELDHFPSHNELNKIGMRDLSGAIVKYGGSVYFREKCGFSPSMQEKYRSKLGSYVNKRGQKTEQFVKDIIIEWTEIHNEPTPNCNVNLSKGNVLEFVCDLDMKIGIDVTNTKASKSVTYNQIKKKWRYKDYHLHLDELWIVVFTDVLTSIDYEKLNQISPENVKVFSIEEFLKELDYSTENLDKINRLNKCTFHNKEEMINPNRTYI